MKPEQFIREFGVEKAREVVEGHSKAYMPEIFKYWSEELNDYVLAPKYASFLVKDLKRLVESLDFVETCGGIESCRKKLSTHVECKPSATHFAIHPEKPHLIQMYRRSEPKLEPNYSFAKLKKAVADHESIYGGRESHAN
ncbi:hypothetical protein CAT36_07680 [Acinetobacter pittii]|uniref:hypothetical protein n=1 Tax=Acinetobacter pittii TaxID=48296 RepID=UPI000A394832|nr:hypothetical protein [Acinetobacter pittii]OTU51894.1 hypothetical protein CAT36_07680 [Acinetobacter pittii]